MVAILSRSVRRPFLIVADEFEVRSIGQGATQMGKGNFSNTPQARYLEDYVTGDVHTFGPISITEDEIVQFGNTFDPQFFHTDPEKAKQSVYGGLIASGWHTCSLFMRLFVEHYLPGEASLGSPGVDQLRWLKPVRPGDSLTLRITVHEVKPSRSKPDRGVLFSFCEMLNQAGDIVATMMAMNLIRYRDRGQ
jgi:acyl dehydratase